MSIILKGDARVHPLVAGDNASGSITVDGGTVLSSSIVLLGRNEAGSGSLLVSGDGTEVNVHGPSNYISAGDYGTGRMTVSGGAAVTLTSSSRASFSVGSGADGRGSVTLSGEGSRISISDASGGSTIIGGGMGGGSLLVSDGAQFTSSANRTMLVGGWSEYLYIPAPGGKVVVDGNGDADTLLDAGKSLVIGHVNSGSVSVLDSARLAAAEITVTERGSLSGNATVRGAVTVAEGGTIGVGGAGDLRLAGSLVMTGGTLEAAIRSDGTAGAVKVSGEVVLDSISVDVRAADGGAAGQMVLIQGGGGLALNGDVTVTLDRAAADDTFILRDKGKTLTLEVIGGSGPTLIDLAGLGLVGVTQSIDRGKGEITGAGAARLLFFNADGLVGTTGEDVLTGSAGNEDLRGGAGADVIEGGGGDDRLDGGGGNDTLSGEGGHNRLIGGTGNDALFASRSGRADLLSGGAGDDVLTGSNVRYDSGAFDRLLGGSGDDVIRSVSFGDHVDGGTGKDTLDLSFEDYGCVVDLEAGTMDMAGFQTVTIAGVENVIGGKLPLLVVGSRGANILTGGLTWGDWLIGAGGADTLTGGAGADYFVYHSASESASGSPHDTVTDFESGTDTLDFSAIDAKASQGGDDAFLLTGNDGQDGFAAGVEGQIRISLRDGVTVVLADLDGDGRADMRIDLTGAMTLTAADFVL